MLRNIKLKIEDTTVIELIESATFPDPENLSAALNAYRNDPELELQGYYLEDQIIGLIGYRMMDNNILVLKHIAVLDEERLHGFGRGMILEVLALKEPQVIIAETDEFTVNFYRSIGFTVESMGEGYP